MQTPKKNFTVGNISEFFMAYDEPNFAMMVEVSQENILADYVVRIISKRAKHIFLMPTLFAGH